MHVDMCERQRETPTVCTHPVTYSPVSRWLSYRHSEKTLVNTDWFLHTDAEGDTNTLINWPSRYPGWYAATCCVTIWLCLANSH